MDTGAARGAISAREVGTGGQGSGREGQGVTEGLPAAHSIEVAGVNHTVPLVGGGEWTEYRPATTPELVCLGDGVERLVKATGWQPHQAMARPQVELLVLSVVLLHAIGGC